MVNPEPSRVSVCGADGSICPSPNGKKRIAPGSGAPAGAASVSRTFGPSPVAVAVHPVIGRGSASRVARIGVPHVGCASALVATGSVSVRSAPSGMQVSSQTSQSARAASVTGVPAGSVAGTARSTRWNTSPS